MFIKHFFTMFVQDKPIVSISVCIFMRTLFLVKYFLKLLSIERKNEVCCCCLMCRTKLRSETSSVTKQKNIFKNLENFWFSTIMFSTEVCVWQIFRWKFHRNKSSQQTFVGLEDVFKTCLEDVFNASSAWQLYAFQVVLKTSCKEVLKTSWRRLGRRKIITLKTSGRHVLKTSWRHALRMPWTHVLKTS